jgi:protein TonB
VYSPCDTLFYGDDVDVTPEFPGGNAALMQFIWDNTQNPKVFEEINYQGVVVVRFIIDETGKIVCPRVVLSLYPECDAEALRVIQLLPRFSPARKDYRPVNFSYTVPFVFNTYHGRRMDHGWIMHDELIDLEE